MTRFVPVLLTLALLVAACSAPSPTAPGDDGDDGFVPSVSAPAGPISRVWPVEGRITSPDDVEVTDCPFPGAKIHGLVAENSALMTGDHRFGGILQVEATGETLTGPVSGFPITGGGWMWPVESGGLYRLTCLRYGEELVLANLEGLEGPGYEVVQLGDCELAVHVL